ncbi:hypothetical protein RchiOBHm_Chr3g0493081 [Rosa chinensis]|uniref:Uncharacterized protein n=1 Tax=Rosa chinensis TaxID=74649 RepID=A0A2P6RGM8_ROSCH|nr:hypothetical protein RchiOBHm_Chr3g0493081 [Rosa chinensis]
MDRMLLDWLSVVIGLPIWLWRRVQGLGMVFGGVSRRWVRRQRHPFLSGISGGGAARLV